MEIEIRARNVQLTDQLRSDVDRHFGKVGKKVSPLATLHVELRAERNPAIADDKVAEARLHLKGAVLRAQGASADMTHAVELSADKLSKQVERYLDRRRNHRAP